MNTRLLWAIGLSAICSVTIAQDAAVESLLAKMRKAYSSAKTAKIVVKTTGPRFGTDPVVTELTYMKERKIYAKLTGSFPGRTREFVSDGQKTSIDDLSGNVLLSEFDPDAIPIPINLEAMSFWDWKRQLSTSPGSNMEKSRMKVISNVAWNSKKWTVLQETALGQSVYVDYYIDPKTSFIHRVRVYDLKKENLRLETVVTKLQINPSVNPSIFKVKTPKTGGIQKTVQKKIKF